MSVITSTNHVVLHVALAEKTN